MEKDIRLNTDEPVVIDIRALEKVKDMATAKFRSEMAPELHKVLFETLADYIVLQGGKPGFRVKL